MDVLPFISGFVAIFMGLVVLLSGGKVASRLGFIIFALAMGVWSVGISLFLVTSNIHDATAYAKLYYIAALLLIYGFACFALNWKNTHLKVTKKSYKKELLLLVPVILISILVLLPDVFMRSVATIPSHSVELVTWSYGLYTGLFVSYSIVAFYGLARSINGTEPKSKKYIQQTTLILSVMAVCLPAGALFNLVLPFFNTYNLIAVGPLFVLPISVVVFYAMARHSLFDVRMASARLAAYVFTILVAAVAYGSIVFILLSTASGVDFSLAVKVILIIGTILVALGFAALLKFFNRISDTLFFQNTYTTEEILGRLNTIFVSSTGLEEMLTKSIAIIEKFSRSEFVAFGIRPINGQSQRIIGSNTPTFSQHDIDSVHKLTPRSHEKIIIAKNYQDTSPQLSVLLHKNNIEVLCRLTGDVYSAKEAVGYLVLGPKRSGTSFSAHDAQILEVITNALVLAIENTLRFEEIQHFNETLQEKVDAATKKLRQNNDKLRALDSTKDEFISMASHQLRTPLTSVKGYLSMVLDGDAGKITEEQRKLLNQAYVSSQRMVYTIADLLNVSRLQTGKFEIERSPVNVASIVSEEIAPLQESAKLKNITLSYSAPQFCPPLMLDEMKTRQVIMNFIDNAIYYTPNGGTIEVKAQTSTKMLELLVVDSGMGVPKKDQPHLFTKFYRASNAQRARPDGTGLGLFMAKKIIIAEGGSLIFKSTEGKGSTFGFSFPLVKE